MIDHNRVANGQLADERGLAEGSWGVDVDNRRRIDTIGNISISFDPLDSKS